LFFGGEFIDEAVDEPEAIMRRPRRIQKVFLAPGQIVEDLSGHQRTRVTAGKNDCAKIGAVFGDCSSVNSQAGEATGVEIEVSGPLVQNKT
jgi:hypothetical protein